MKVLAIVGSVMFQDRFAFRRAEDIIVGEIETYQPEVCTSGGAPGIDTLFHTTAERFGFTGYLELYPEDWDKLPFVTAHEPAFIAFLPRRDILELPPGAARWNAPGGYKQRNIQVATFCARMCAIRCHASLTYGSGWTVAYAERLGREVRRELL